MKMKPWMPLVMIAVMALGMIALMVVIGMVFGASGGMGQLMSMEALALLVLGGMMFLILRWVARRMGLLPDRESIPGQNGQEGESQHTTTLTFTIPNINCDGCKTRIESELGLMPGVASVSVDVEKQQAEVTLINPPGRSEIETHLDSIGYPARAGS